MDQEVSIRANCFNVDRGDVTSSFRRVLQRANFDPLCKIDVLFVDVDDMSEGSIDGGGPTREFLRLLMCEIIRGDMFEGPPDCRMLKFSTIGNKIKYNSSWMFDSERNNHIHTLYLTQFY